MNTSFPLLNPCVPQPRRASIQLDEARTQQSSHSGAGSVSVLILKSPIVVFLEQIQSPKHAQYARFGR